MVVDWICLLCASCEPRNCCEEEGRDLGDNVKVVENKESRELWLKDGGKSHVFGFGKRNLFSS